MIQRGQMISQETLDKTKIQDTDLPFCDFKALGSLLYKQAELAWDREKQEA